MIEDPNVERLVKKHTDPLKRHIDTMQSELDSLKRKLDSGDFNESALRSKESIDSEIIVDLKNATTEQREQVVSLFRQNYENLLSDMLKEADYAKVDGYWSDHKPFSRPIMKAEDFIAKYNANEKQ